MDASAVGVAAAPIIAVAISLITFILTQIRTQQLDTRSAAKDTVDILATQNKALVDEVASLRVRVIYIERQHNDCEHERTNLLNQLLQMQNEIHNSKS